MTTDNLPVMSGYWEKIAALKKQLAFPNKPTANTPKPKSSLEELAELYVNSLDNPQEDAWNTTVFENSRTDSTKPVGSMFTNDVVNRSGANGQTSGVNSDPYAIEWTGEQEKRKRLNDAKIERENLLGRMGLSTPTTEDVVALGELDTKIKQLAQGLGLGPKEYTRGVEDGGANYDDWKLRAGKQSMEDTYRDLLDMNFNEKVDFAYSDAGKEYFLNIEDNATPEEREKYLTVLFGDTDRYEIPENGDIIVLTAPDISDPLSSFWYTHERPENFDPNDPDLGEAPLKPSIMALHPADYYDPVTGKTIEFDNGYFSVLAGNAYDKYANGAGDINAYGKLMSVLTGEGLESGENALVEYAKAFVGELPYVVGGRDLTSGADCSGFAQAIYKACGIDIRGTTASMAEKAQTMAEKGDNEHFFKGPGMGSGIEPVRFNGTIDEAKQQLDEYLSGLKPGDLIYFDVGESHDRGVINEKGEIVPVYGHVDHVVIYAGQDENGNHMIVQEHEPGRDAEYHNIDMFIFNRAGNNPAGDTEFSNNYDWEQRMPVYTIREMSDEQRERLTIP